MRRRSTGVVQSFVLSLSSLDDARDDLDPSTGSGSPRAGSRGEQVEESKDERCGSLGTDWSVAPLNPMLTVYAAATRATLDGRNPNGWVPEQKITIAEAVSAYTAGSAFAEFQEGSKGTIARGKLADLVILSDDIFNIPAARIKDVRVLTTIVGGRVVHQRNP